MNQTLKNGLMSATEIGDIVKFVSSCSNSEQAGSRLGVVVVDAEMFDGNVLIAEIRPEVEKWQQDLISIALSPKDIDKGELDKESVIRLNALQVVPPDGTQRVARLNKDKIDELLRQFTKLGVAAHYSVFHGDGRFEPGKSSVPITGRVYGPEEMECLVDAALDFWLTTGRFNRAFEGRLADFLGVKHVLTTNSGSSANLLAISALTSVKLEDRRLRPGDEVITVAAGFPTTVNPIIQNGLVPVFVDVDIPTYNIEPDLIEAAMSEKTRAIMLAHTLGNPFDVSEVLRVARKYDLWIVEDCCDALGSTYDVDPSLASSSSSLTPTNKCGTFGHISTFSFYPAHHITMGEGGAVATNDSQLKRIIESFRDWGRDCWCSPGDDNTCKHRFDWQLGDLPKGYDHKYIYSHMGYNLKITDMQAAVGLTQMDKLEEFIRIRQRNFGLLTQGLQKFEEFFILPQATPNSIPSWFGYPITIRQDTGFQRQKLLQHLNENRIGTRLLFGGNLIRQPYFKEKVYRINGDLMNTEKILNDTFWIGVYPRIAESMIEFVVAKIGEFINLRS